MPRVTKVRIKRERDEILIIGLTPIGRGSYRKTGVVRVPADGLRAAISKPAVLATIGLNVFATD